MNKRIPVIIGAAIGALMLGYDLTSAAFAALCTFLVTEMAQRG